MTEVINVLQVIGGLNRGGAETFIMNVTRNIDKEKYKFYFLCYGYNHFDYEEEAKCLGSKIIKIPRPAKSFDVQTIRTIEKIITDNNIDVVHTHTLYNSMYAVIAARNKKVKTIITHSHNTVSETNPGLIKKAYFSISKIVINLFSTKKIACGIDAGRALYYGKKFQVINNGINIKQFQYSEKKRSRIRKQYGIKNDEILIGHVGRFEPVKNHAFIIKIAEILSHTHIKYKFILIGDGPEKNNIDTSIKDKQLQDKIILAGKCTNMDEMYSAMDIMVFPSLFEGMPVSMIEAQINGLKILASDRIDKRISFSNITFLDISNAKTWASTIQNLDDYKHIPPDKEKIKQYDIKNVVSELGKIYDHH